MRVLVAFHRTKRRLRWIVGRERYARDRAMQPLPFRAHRHSSLLVRRLGDSDPELQISKITNLRITASLLDGLLIRPGETFSFCRLVGRPTRARGFVEGLELSRGEARKGVGGGICQAANLLHWLVLHSPLAVMERSQHSFDPFPDDGRIIPFGTGAAIFYNYVDYQFHNPTPWTFQIRLWLTGKTLEGDLRCSSELEHKYRVREQNHAFLKIGGNFYRANEIWRIRTRKCRSDPDEETLMTRNFALLKYEPKEFLTVRPGQKTVMLRAL
ncbi:MAG: vancomycin resistance protein [Verrucomicrobiaceae bacterium]|nr:MAG: vancomycin resistance protein [Verrucomicrobiaceae bacterium]